MLIVASLSVLTVTNTPKVKALDWWVTDWNYTRTVTIESDYINQSLQNFVVSVPIPTEVAQKCQPNGEDIRFLNVTNEYEFPYEIDYWNASGTSYAWVNITEVIYNDTDFVFNLYYNNSGCVDNQSEDVVWASYSGVYHMNASLPNVTYCMNDSASADGWQNGTVGNGAPLSNTSGVIGDCTYFDKSRSTWYNLGDVHDVWDTSFTLEFWVKPVFSYPSNILSLWNKRNSGSGHGLMTIVNESYPIDIYTYTSGTGTNLYLWHNRSVGRNINDGEWHHIVYSYDQPNTVSRLIVDGGETNYSQMTKNIGSRAVTDSLVFGKDYNAASKYYNGLVDEVRFTNNTAHNLSWIMANYNNTNTTDFVTLGGERGQGASFSCQSMPDENSTWSHSEHLRHAVPDENWTYSNNTLWTSYPIATWMGNYTLNYNSSGNPFGYAFLNSSGMNRSQTLIWIHHNISDDVVFSGPIYSARNGTHFDMVLYGANYVLLLTSNGTNLTNTNDSTLVEDLADAYNYYDFVNPWGTNQDGSSYYHAMPWADQGSWVKTIYNAQCGYLHSKCWGDDTIMGLMNEPAGWQINYSSLINVSYQQNTTCHGVATWGPGQEFDAQFDFINVWQLNYSRNISGEFWWDTNGTYGRPHMDFPIINIMDHAQAIYDLWFNASFSGNLTLDNLTDLVRNLTNDFSMVSRPYAPNSSNAQDQNDTVYYYSAVLTNWSTWWEQFFPDDPVPAILYNNFLYLWIDDCPDGDDAVGFDAGFIGIDVDNNGTMDPNDRMYYWETTYPPIGIALEWHGNVISGEWNINATGGETNKNAVINIHRYGPHITHRVLIPMDQLKTWDNKSMNASHTFGLCIATFNTDDNNICFWQNYNESLCSPFADESHNYIKTLVLNTTALGDYNLTVDDHNFGYWGEGRTGDGTFNYSGSYGVNITKESNISSMPTNWTNDTSHIIRYWLNITNTGSGGLTGFILNETWYNCSCSKWNWTLYANQTEYYWHLNVTNDTDNCTINMTIPDLAGGETFNIWFDVLVTNCNNETGIMGNWANITCDQGVSDTNYWGITWGLQTTLIRIRGTTTNTNVEGIGTNIFNIVGVVLIIGAIMTIVGIVYINYRKGGR